MVIRLDEDNHIEYLKSDWTWSKRKGEARIHFHESDAIWALMVKRQKGEDLEEEAIAKDIPKEAQSLWEIDK